MKIANITYVKDGITLEVSYGRKGHTYCTFSENEKGDVINCKVHTDISTVIETMKLTTDEIAVIAFVNGEASLS